MPLGLPHVASHQCSKLHRRLCIGVSGANRIDRCLCIGSSGATGFCKTHPFQFFLSSFFVFCFVWPFCFIPGIYKYLLNKLISPIDCGVTQSPKSQNNVLMRPCSLQWCKCARHIWAEMGTEKPRKTLAEKISAVEVVKYILLLEEGVQIKIVTFS